MQHHDAEIDRLKDRVSCAVVLERADPPWRLDKRESTLDSLKYRRGRGEIIIVNHRQRGWWDASDPVAKGDVFGLVQHLNPGCHFGEARRILRGLAGVVPAFPLHEGGRRGAPSLPPEARWQHARHPRPGTPAWHYLHDVRRLPSSIIDAAVKADVLRESRHGTALFAHRDHAGILTGMEMRGPDFRGFSKGHDKTLFRLPRRGRSLTAARRHRGADRRDEPRGTRGTARRHVSHGHRRRHGTGHASVPRSTDR